MESELLAEGGDGYESVLSKVVEVLDGMKGDDIEVLMIGEKSSFADVMVVASGGVPRKVIAMAESVVEAIGSVRGRKPLVEGLSSGDWVVIDGGDIVVHLFRPEVRDFYRIEEIWK